MKVELQSLSHNQRFALNVFVPFLYLFPLLVAYFSPKNFGFGNPQWVFLALGIGLAGLVLWILGMIQLGKSFAVLPGSDALVSKGVYRYVRHPIYIGICLQTDSSMMHQIQRIDNPSWFHSTPKWVFWYSYDPDRTQSSNQSRPTHRLH